MMKLLEADGAWLAMGISVSFVVVGLVMKRLFVQVLKSSETAPGASDNPTGNQQHE